MLCETRSRNSGSIMRTCSPGPAASERRRWRGSWPSASTAKPASPTLRAAVALPARRSTAAGSSTTWRWTPLPTRGVDEMTQLLERAIYSPTSGRFKVYVIDEVHQLSGHAFNAMLKTLEEPPAHLKFVLATTDPQKVPVTVLSRCLQFNLKQMPRDAIVEASGGGA